MPVYGRTVQSTLDNKEKEINISYRLNTRSLEVILVLKDGGAQRQKQKRMFL